MEALLYCLLLASAVALVPATAGHVLAGWPWWFGGVLLAAGWVGALTVIPLWRLQLTDIAVYLDRRLPAMEESCCLLLRPEEELSGMQQWQARRVRRRLEGLPMPRPFYARLWRAAGWLGLAALVSIVIGWVGGKRPAERTVASAVMGGAAAVVPGLEKTVVDITPPAYTGRVMRHQQQLNIQAEEGASVEWALRTSAPADSVELVFNGTTRWPLRSEDKDKTNWRLTRQALQPGFYQVKLGDRLSDLYTFGIIRDDPPRIIVHRPKGYTVVDYGEPATIALELQVLDDYGVADVAVMATVSSGRGEAVKFKGQQLRWGKAFGAPAYQLKKTLDLPALGLAPGDELYFYCEARDNHGQETRTETFIVSLTDTSQLMSLEGMVMPTDVKPAFFRSERQIIIETEQLLREQDTLPASAFKDRSNGLGIDQKLLRLRYGKFLGEEAEEGEPDLDTVTLGVFGDATKILDVFTDKHDNAEDATYFEPSVKQQLKATLNEMWGAELRLRTYRPKEALPYCYKALRLLKDLQQQSRAYVAKTGVRVEPLNPAKRLTGELGAIRPSEQRVDRDGAMTEEELLRTGLAVLEAMREGVTPGYAGRQVLQRVEQRLAGEASADPARLLKAYAAMRRVSGEAKGACGADIELVQRALARLLPVAEAEPAVRKGVADGGLTRLYFNFLKK